MMRSIARIVGVQGPNWLIILPVISISNLYWMWPQVHNEIAITIQRHADLPTWHLVLSLVPVLAEAAPTLAIVVGVLLLLAPGRRFLALRKKFRTREKGHLDAQLHGILTEAREYMAKRGQALAISYNFADTRLICFAHPRKWLRQGITLGGAFAMSWYADRPIAKIFLKHELAHIARGDGLFIGVGSPLDFVLRRWLLMAALTILVPATLLATGNSLVVFGAVEKIRHFNAGIDYRASDFELSILQSLDVEVLARLATVWDSVSLTFNEEFPLWWQGLHGSAGMLFFENAVAFMLPILAVWGAEFGADRQSIDDAGEGKRLDGWLREQAQGSSIWQSLMNGLSHPPFAVRRLMLKVKSDIIFQLLMTLMFPAGFLSMALMILGRDTWIYLEGLAQPQQIQRDLAGFYFDMSRFEIPFCGAFLILRALVLAPLRAALSSAIGAIIGISLIAIPLVLSPQQLYLWLLRYGG